MLTDRQGNPIADASVEAVALYDQAVEAFNLYRGDPIALLDQALEMAPRFAMARILKAYLYGLATEPAAAAEASKLLDQLKSQPLNEREISLVKALDLLLAGNWTESASALDYHGIAFPRDIVAVQCGHLMDFYRAGTRSLRDRLARTLPAWSRDTPGYSILLGMYSFGLEECGDYPKAEDVGRQAVELQPLDCWAHHAVAHVMEMQGRAEDGIGWMVAREPQWSGDDNFFKVHNWWHLALFHLSQDRPEKSLALYDGAIRKDRSVVALDLVDASALLWRLHLVGLDVGERWLEVSQAWEQHADGKLYAFNDWHAVMAHLGAGREPEVERILASYRKMATADAENARWARDIGLPLAEGFRAFWSKDYATATDRLHRARYVANAFGGSHAQRDIIDWTLTEAALRGGQHDLAAAMAQDRLALKPHSPINSNFLTRAQQGKRAKVQAA